MIPADLKAPPQFPLGGHRFFQGAIAKADTEIRVQGNIRQAKGGQGLLGLPVFQQSLVIPRRRVAKELFGFDLLSWPQNRPPLKIRQAEL